MPKELKNPTIYKCINAKCDGALLYQETDALCCPNGHRYPFAPESKVPVFAKVGGSESEYGAEDAAVIHDNALRWVFETFKTPENELRKNLIGRLGLKPGQRILVTGAGAGNDLPYIMENLKTGSIYAQDISEQMLLAGYRRLSQLSNYPDVEVHFSLSDATDIPFSDRSFDAAFHFGGINFYSNIKKGLSEMARVVKDGGRVVIGDEGLAPWLTDTQYGRMLIENNPLYASKIPLECLPEVASEVKLSWELAGCFYVIEFVVASSGPQINIDIPHIGKRGGSIRTRFFGKLEGIDPKLKDTIYAESERRGVSRVAFLESIIKKGLGEN